MIQRMILALRRPAIGLLAILAFWATAYSSYIFGVPTLGRWCLLGATSTVIAVLFAWTTRPRAEPNRSPKPPPTSPASPESFARPM